MTIDAFRDLKASRGENAKHGNLCWYCRFNCSTEDCNKYGNDCSRFEEMDDMAKRTYTYQAFKELKESYNNSLADAHTKLRKLTKGLDR